MKCERNKKEVKTNLHAEFAGRAIQQEKPVAQIPGLLFLLDSPSTLGLFFSDKMFFPRVNTHEVTSRTVPATFCERIHEFKHTVE